MSDKMGEKMGEKIRKEIRSVLKEQQYFGTKGLYHDPEGPGVSTKPYKRKILIHSPFVEIDFSKLTSGDITALFHRDGELTIIDEAKFVGMKKGAAIYNCRAFDKNIEGKWFYGKVKIYISENGTVKVDYDNYPWEYENE